VGIFQSFDDGQNKILFRALIRKNKQLVGWQAADAARRVGNVLHAAWSLQQAESQPQSQSESLPQPQVPLSYLWLGVVD